MLAMNIFLAVPALAENYQEYGLYDSDGNYKGIFYWFDRRKTFYKSSQMFISMSRDTPRSVLGALAVRVRLPSIRSRIASSV